MMRYQLPEIFPHNNEENEWLFQLLQKAYVGRRYKNDYSITTTDLQKIKVMVNSLKDEMKNCIKALAEEGLIINSQLQITENPGKSLGNFGFSRSQYYENVYSMPAKLNYNNRKKYSKCTKPGSKNTIAPHRYVEI
jgi:hypothetical protein